jgi:branched-chain amino acid transport system substrate-binding protein
VLSTRALSALTVLGTMLAVGCGGGGSEQATTAQTVNIGAICDLSGRLATFGNACKDAMNLAVNQINGNGGFKVGSQAFKYNVTVVDGRSDATASVAAANGLIHDQNIKFLFGPDTSPTSLQVNALIKGGDQIEFTGGSSPQAILGTPGYENLFGVILENETWVGPVLPMAQALKIKSGGRIAVVYTDDAAGTSVVPIFEKILKGAGYTVDVYRYPTTTTDFHPLMTRIKGTNPDCIVAGFAVSAELPMARAIIELNAAPCLIDVGARPADIPLKIAQETGKPFPIAWASLNSIPSVEAATTPGMVKYKAYYVKETGKDPTAAEATYTVLFYDFPGMLAKAMVKAKTVSDIAAIRKQLETLQYNDGALANLHFNPKHIAIYSMDNATVIDGKTTWLSVNPS